MQFTPVVMLTDVCPADHKEVGFGGLRFNPKWGQTTDPRGVAAAFADSEWKGPKRRVEWSRFLNNEC
jgi:hypothetical protein